MLEAAMLGIPYTGRYDMADRFSNQQHPVVERRC